MCFVYDIRKDRLAERISATNLNEWLLRFPPSSSSSSASVSFLVPLRVPEVYNPTFSAKYEPFRFSGTRQGSPCVRPPPPFLYSPSRVLPTPMTYQPFIVLIPRDYNLLLVWSLDLLSLNPIESTKPRVLMGKYLLHTKLLRSTTRKATTRQVKMRERTLKPGPESQPTTGSLPTRD